MIYRWPRSLQGLQRDGPSSFVNPLQHVTHASTYGFSDKTLHVEDNSSREHRLKHILSLFCLTISEEAKRRMVFAEGLIQCPLLIPSC
jgi:hypothetical protein